MRGKNKFDLYFYSAFSLGACLKLGLFKNTRVLCGVYFWYTFHAHSAVSVNAKKSQLIVLYIIIIVF